MVQLTSEPLIERRLKLFDGMIDPELPIERRLELLDGRTDLQTSDREETETI